MVKGNYKAIANDDLTLEDSPEYWIKNKIYKANVDETGVMHLEGETTITHYTPDAVEKMKDVLLFTKEEP